jgi:general secretion pathway protein G
LYRRKHGRETPEHAHEEKRAIYRGMTVKKSHTSGFTLVEILIVVTLLGVLASIVVPSFRSASDEAQHTTFVTNVKTFAEAAMLYREKTGQHLEDSGSGDCPTGWEPYIDERAWTSDTPIGGVWDFEQNSYGIVSAFGVHFMAGHGAQKDDAFMVEIDKLMDDGDLATGVFRKIDNDRYYYIIEG